MAIWYTETKVMNSAPYLSVAGRRHALQRRYGKQGISDDTQNSLRAAFHFSLRDGDCRVAAVRYRPRRIHFGRRVAFRRRRSVSAASANTAHAHRRHPRSREEEI